MLKVKEIEVQLEFDDGEEDGREEGKFLKCLFCVKISNYNVEILEVGRF